MIYSRSDPIDDPMKKNDGPSGAPLEVGSSTPLNIYIYISPADWDLMGSNLDLKKPGLLWFIGFDVKGMQLSSKLIAAHRCMWK